MWDATDLLVAGRHCSDADVRFRLEALRKSCRSPLAILLAYAGDRVLRSLTFVASHSAIGEQIVPCLLDSLTRPDASEIIGTYIHHRNASSTETLQSRLTAILLDTEIDRRRIKNLTISTLSTDEAKSAAICPVILLLTPRPLSRWRQRPVRELGAMLNGTSKAASHRDLLVMQKLDLLSTPVAANGLALSFDRMAAKASELALDITDSDVAAAYIRDPGHPTRLVLVASHLSKLRASDSPERLLAPYASLLTEVFNDHKARQYPTGSAVAFATPIAGPLASPALPAIGVLIVCRLSPPDAYTAYHIALLRNLSLRLALFHFNSGASRLAEQVAEYRRTVQPVASAPTRSLMSGRWPGYIHSALSDVPATLEVAATITASQCVEVRLALSDFSAPEPHGNALTRVCAFPEDTADDSHRVLQERRDGGCAWVAMRQGRIVYLPDVTAGSGSSCYVPCREGIRSELVVPIRSEGELIGVLNLESPLPNAYAGFIPGVQALAGAIGRSVGEAVARAAGGAVRRVASILDRAHDIEPHLSDAVAEVEARGEASAESLDSLREVAEFIESIRATDFSGPAEVDHIATLESIFGEVFHADLAAPFPHLQLHGDRALLSEVRLGPTAGRHLRLALRNIARNLVTHGADSTHRSVRFAKSQWDGREHITVQFENPSKGATEIDPLSLYRVPHVDERGELRLGAFLTGLEVRQLGGSVHCATDARGRILRTVVMLPCGDLDA